MASSADWAGLQVDILDLILEKVRSRSIQDFRFIQSSIQDFKFIQDSVAFGSVCNSWREAATTNKHYLCPPQIPWMVVPDYKNNRLLCGLRREESEEYTLRTNLPIPYNFNEDKCFALNYGWILTVSQWEDMNLFHPLSRSRIELPPSQYPNYIFISRAALSSNPSQTSDLALTIVQGIPKCLSYTSLVDKGLTQILEIQLPYTGSWSDFTYYQDQLYAVDYNGKVWRLGFKVSDPNYVLVADLSIPAGKAFKTFIVGSEGDLLVVVRNYTSAAAKFGGKWVGFFKVHRVDLINGEHKQTTSLGDKAIFVGNNTTTMIIEFPGGLIKPNHIYYTASDAFCSYRLEDGLRTRLNVPMSLSTRKPCSFWYMPSL